MLWNFFNFFQRLGILVFLKIYFEKQQPFLQTLPGCQGSFILGVQKNLQHHPACLRQKSISAQDICTQERLLRSTGGSSAQSSASDTSRLLQSLSTQGNLLGLAVLLAGDICGQPLFQDLQKNKPKYILYMITQTHERVWGPFLGTKRGFRDKGLLFTTCLYKIQAHAVHTHPYTMECNCREQLSYFFMRHVYVWVDNGNSNGLVGIGNRILCRYGKKTKTQQLPRSVCCSSEQSLYKPPRELKSN